VPHEADSPAEAGEAASASSHDAEENERRRRRRGRRGGRVRPRREDEPAATAVAAERIEVVVSAGDSEPAVTEENEETLPELETWPAEADIETASLAPLAGEPAGSEPSSERYQQPHSEPDAVPEAELALTAEAESGIPFDDEAEKVLERATANGAAEHAEPEAALASRAADDVHTVTEKPANPRRGWWQRLLQP